MVSYLFLTWTPTFDAHSSEDRLRAIQTEEHSNEHEGSALLTGGLDIGKNDGVKRNRLCCGLRVH